MIDWRLPKYREELFYRYFYWRFTVHDLDHSHYCRVLTRQMTDGQKCWFCLLFGMTYRTPQAYAYWHHFNDFDLIELDSVERWNADNWKRTTYGTDARYNKGYFAFQVKSIKKWCGERSLLYKIRESVQEGKTKKDKFFNLFRSIQQLNRYGRMMSWITCQCLYDVLEFDIDFDDVLIADPRKDSSMQSIWNGYQALKNRPAAMLGKYSTVPYQPNDQDIRDVAKDIMVYRQNVFKLTGIWADVFKWESIWCQFKRLFNATKSKEYPGHATGDAVSRYLYYRRYWPEVDWSLFREALLTQDSIIKGQTYVPQYNSVFGDTGLLLNMHEMYDDLPDAYRLLGYDANLNLVKQLFLDHRMNVPYL